MDDFSITQYGQPLAKSKYIIDIDTKTFESKEDDLVLNFQNGMGWTFYTGYSCNFKTDSDCTFHTGHSCTFDCGNYCTFNTSYGCTFHTGRSCTFHTGDNCTFSLLEIKKCQFKRFDGNSIILDRDNSKRYCLNEDLKKMLKVMHG